MNTWTVILIIAVIGAVFSLNRSRWARHGGQMNGDWGDGRADPPAGPSPREEELQREVEELRERVKVLERIATDNHSARSIADEIESLRDK